jgi:hypothetical protein
VNEAPPEIMSNVGVIEDAGGDEWMGHLQQHRRSAPQIRDEWRVAESPDHAFRREVAIPALKSLRMCGRTRISSAGPTPCHPRRMPKTRTHPPTRPSRPIRWFGRNGTGISAARCRTAAHARFSGTGHKVDHCRVLAELRRGLPVRCPLAGKVSRFRGDWDRSATSLLLAATRFRCFAASRCGGRSHLWVVVGSSARARR